MNKQVIVFDPTTLDKQSAVRGIGRYLQLLKENFPEWKFIGNETMKQCNNEAIFINPFFNFLQPPLTMKRIAQKQIAVIHDLIPLKYPGHFPAGIKGSINIFLNKLALKNYDLIVTDSEASKKDIVQMLKFEESRVRVIYPCLTKVFLKTENLKLNENCLPAVKAGKMKTENYCLYVGDVTWNKNLVNLAKAIKIADISCIFVGKVFEGLKKESEDTCFEQIAWAPLGEAGEKHGVKLSSLNNPWLKEFNEFIQITNGDKRFIFKGYVTDYELIKLYQQATANILISRDEGFGFSYVEAAQFGCPSILSNVPVLKEISAGQGALFTDPNKPEVITQQILKVYNNVQIREKLSLEAQQRTNVFSSSIFKLNWKKV